MDLVTFENKKAEKISTIGQALAIARS